jgi:hypothetical protein
VNWDHRGAGHSKLFEWPHQKSFRFWTSKQRVKHGKVWIFRDGLMNSVGLSKSSHQRETVFSRTRRTLDVDGGPDR